MSVPFDLTCWYLNARRIAELTGVSALVQNTITTSDHLQRLAELNALRRGITEWIRVRKPQPLGKLIIESTLTEGAVFTHNTNFFFKGLSAVSGKVAKGVPLTTLPKGYAKLDDWIEGGKLTFDFHPEHLTSNSSWVELSGQKRMFVLGVVTEISETEIKAKPYVIGNIVENKGEFFGIGRWANHLEIFIDQIENFSTVRDYTPRMTKKSLLALKDIPEQSVKDAFAEIINEPTVPKDWGGEKSDLFSTNVRIDGQRVATAFAFKGPAKFTPMRMAELGKNGDQISRLFEEPADLLVLQHCHEITPDVRKTMRAFAQQMGNPRTYCVIDGYETLRLLEAYGKCGLTAKAKTA